MRTPNRKVVLYQHTTKCDGIILSLSWHAINYSRQTDRISNDNIYLNEKFQSLILFMSWVQHETQKHQLNGACFFQVPATKRVEIYKSWCSLLLCSLLTRRHKFVHPRSAAIYIIVFNTVLCTARLHAQNWVCFQVCERQDWTIYSWIASIALCWMHLSQRRRETQSAINTHWLREEIHGRRRGNKQAKCSTIAFVFIFCTISERIEREKWARKRQHSQPAQHNNTETREIIQLVPQHDLQERW